MSAHPLPCPVPDAVDPAAERAARHGAMLRELAEIGMTIARAVGRQAEAQRDLQDVGDQAGVKEVVGAVITLQIRGDYGRVFDRLTRAIRLTMALETRIAEGELARCARAAAQSDYLRAARGCADAVEAVPARTRSARPVVDAAVDAGDDADSEAPEPPEALNERLWERDEDFGLQARPADAVIGEIRRELEVAAEGVGLGEVNGVSGGFAAADDPGGGSAARVEAPVGSSP